MKLTAVLVAICAAAASADDAPFRSTLLDPHTSHPFDRYPGCSVDCLKSSFDEAGCAYSDTKCGCIHKRVITMRSRPCLWAHCTMDECIKIKNMALEACDRLEKKI
ncbi:Extracellular membrane protein, CFEM domain protein [Metarhizium guizhouense ARSEF 977]|uniref:Extracellular membrane protein, CFEM domain protein n=1 Tax=Metarhizium guizhouense (strain ARSEF 977) TaxID=1276136 RepID=A0A0B4HWQ4_METGA|nr:Extracellular membrane protein, CFEM domain protein [Metarhizium guizhouense ARSEF 977]